ncbi:MAG: rhodanese-like domain-containing protein [Candidatus Hodarchaeales archaeon]|jgi:predicted sulfurtransferase
MFVNDNLKRKEVNMFKKVSILFFIVVFALVSVAVQAADKIPAQLVKEARAAVKEVSADDLKKMIDSKEKVIILDIRDPSEYEKEHIPGAIHMSRGLVDLHVNEIIQDKDAKIVVY